MATKRKQEDVASPDTGTKKSKIPLQVLVLRAVLVPSIISQESTKQEEVWREMELLSTHTLNDVHELLDAEFQIHGVATFVIGSTTYYSIVAEKKPSFDVTLGSLDLRKTHFEYLPDLGLNLKLEITVKSSSAADTEEKKELEPRIVAGEGNIPEDTLGLQDDFDDEDEEDEEAEGEDKQDFSEQRSEDPADDDDEDDTEDDDE